MMPEASRRSIVNGLLTRTLFHCVVVAIAVMTAATVAWADDPSGETSKPWEFEFGTPIWIPGNYGTLTVRDHVAHVDVSPNDTWNLLTSGNAFAGEGYFGLRYDRVFAFVDALGGYVDESVSEQVPIKAYPQLGKLSIDAKAKLKDVLVDVGVGYRLGEWTLPERRRPLTLDLYVGARYYGFLTRLRASLGVTKAGIRQAADVSNTVDWTDPLVGVRWQVPLLDCVSANFRGDIGGFNAGSELSWNIVGDVRYWIGASILSTHPYVALGYRALGFTRSSDPHNELDMQFRGPFGTAGFVF